MSKFMENIFLWDKYIREKSSCWKFLHFVEKWINKKILYLFLEILIFWHFDSFALELKNCVEIYSKYSFWDCQKINN